MSPEKEAMEQETHKNGNQNNVLKREKSSDPIQCEEGPGLVAYLLTLGSLLLVAASLPLSLFFVVKVVQVSNFSPTNVNILSNLELILGIREGGYLQTWEAFDRRGTRSWSVLHNTLC